MVRSRRRNGKCEFSALLFRCLPNSWRSWRLYPSWREAEQVSTRFKFVSADNTTERWLRGEREALRFFIYTQGWDDQNGHRYPMPRGYCRKRAVRQMP